MDYKGIGRRIRSYRKKINLSQRTVTEAIDISPEHMSHIENGQVASFAVYANIAKQLHVPVDYFLYDRDQATHQQVIRDFTALIETCSEEEARLLLSITKSAREALNEYLDDTPLGGA